MITVTLHLAWSDASWTILLGHFSTTLTSSAAPESAPSPTRKLTEAFSTEQILIFLGLKCFLPRLRIKHERFVRFLLLIGQSAESRTDGEDAVHLYCVIHFEAFPVVVHLHTNTPLLASATAHNAHQLRTPTAKLTADTLANRVLREDL